MAQNDAKKALATKLAQLQLKTDGAAMADQLTGSAVQPIVAGWSQRLDETVPPARQKDVRDKLDVELKKFADNTHKAVEAQVGKSAEAALVPIFMEKLSEDEMKTIIAYMESPASAKLQALRQTPPTPGPSASSRPRAARWKPAPRPSKAPPTASSARPAARARARAATRQPRNKPPAPDCRHAPSGACALTLLRPTAA